MTFTQLVDDLIGHLYDNRTEDDGHVADSNFNWYHAIAGMAGYALVCAVNVQSQDDNEIPPSSTKFPFILYFELESHKSDRCQVSHQWS